VVHTKIQSTKEKVFTEEELAKPSEEEVLKTLERTKRLLENKVKSKIKSTSSSSGSTLPNVEKNSKYIRYTSGKNNDSFNSGSDTRLIRMVDIPQDPLEPPKFKHKKIPMGPSSPPVPILHSPTKNLSKEERDSWRIPSCLSGYKNNHGYVLPLEMRCFDRRDLTDNTINDKFSKFSQVLYSTEQIVRVEVAKRAALRKKTTID